VALVAVAAAASGAAAQDSGPEAYCVPSNTHLDPTDLHRPGAQPVRLPPGFTRRTISLAGYPTPVIEGGTRHSEEAIVFMHGNPGHSLDYEGILRAAPPGARVIAFDLIGFGWAAKPWDFPFTMEASRPLVDRAFRQLGLRRVHLVGHDMGSVVGIDWAARHPRLLASATLIAGGVLIGYVDHHFARAWKTPGLGEEMMRGTDREGFVGMIQAHSPRPLPREFLDRDYDAFDRATRCTVLRAYRAMPDLSQLGREHAEALRPHDRPALVLWGDRDLFLPVHLAHGNREAFPRADVRVFENSGHWPYVDEEQRTVSLMREFFARHVREQAGARIELTLGPRTLRRGRRTTVTAHARLADHPSQPVAGAVVSLAGRRARTGPDGRARLRVRPPRRARRLTALARKPPLVDGRATVRVRPARRPRR
jgi:pimeloyl-ACP methyl ester carboxylesterase